MNIDVGMVLSMGTTVVLVAVTWGALQAKVRFLSARFEELRSEKVSTEKMEGIIEKIEALEIRLIEKIETVEEKVHEIKEDLTIKKN